MSTEIYYFSGTGNSLFVARELEKRLPDARLIPIMSLQGQKTVKTQSDTVGFVFPVHALTLPIAVKKFIEKTDLSASDYVFAVATRLGTIFRGFEKMDRILSRRKKRLQAGFILTMCNNDTRHGAYTLPTKEEIAAVEEAVLRKLSAIEEIVKGKRESREADTEYTIGASPFTEKMVLAGMVLCEHTGGVQYFYHNEKCTGCGICEKVCLSGKIRLVDKKPVWRRKTFCTMCFACLNYCPKHAVQINDIPFVKSNTQENDRYPHPYASVQDIAAQKSPGSSLPNRD